MKAGNLGESNLRQFETFAYYLKEGKAPAGSAKTVDVYTNGQVLPSFEAPTKGAYQGRGVQGLADDTGITFVVRDASANIMKTYSPRG